MTANNENDIAEIEEPKYPGNYSARKQNRWIKHTTAEQQQNEDLSNSSSDSTLLPVPTPPDVSKLTDHFEDIDEIHKTVSRFHVSPAQMYSTESGQMYHAGSICVVLVGLPARGKTNLSIGLCRYLRWLGVRANLFHLGNYRREKMHDVPNDFFDPKPETQEASTIRQKLIHLAISDMQNFFKNDLGQVAIYDAVNGNSKERLELKETLNKDNVKVIFIESVIDDDKLLDRNIADATKSPDYSAWDPKDAVEDYKKRISVVSHSYETMSEPNLTYIKTINFGERLFINESKHDFLTTKIIFYLMNTKIKLGSIYFARCSNNKLRFKSDPHIDEKGKDYADKLFKATVAHFKDQGRDDIPKNLVVWTSTRLRTTEMSQLFKDKGLIVKHRPELTQLKPGDAEGLSDAELSEKYPSDFKAHQADPYHHRYPRAESYHDLALKLEPLIMEIERMSNDILIIADETIIRVFYGYLMSTSCFDIPSLRFPTDELIDITCDAYMNKASRITIEGVESTD